MRGKSSAAVRKYKCACDSNVHPSSSSACRTGKENLTANGRSSDSISDEVTKSTASS